MGGDYILATENLCKCFGAARVVSDLNLRVPRGSIYGFLGPNGAGKTTTIRLLLSLLRPDRGEVSIFGRDLRRHRKAILKRIGSLVDAPSVYPHLTGRENLQVLTRLLNIRPTRIDEVLRQVELLDAQNKKAGQYSQGMKQRLGLAMALLNAPEILILDEPSNGLDPAGIRDVRELLKRLPSQHGTTVLVSSHLLSEIELVASHLGIINHGNLVFQGPIQELRRNRCGHALLRTNNPGAALELLNRNGVLCRLDGDGVVDLETSLPRDTARANRLLVEAGFEVYAIETRSHRLEDLFMQLTVAERN